MSMPQAKENKASTSYTIHEVFQELIRKCDNWKCDIDMEMDLFKAWAERYADGYDDENRAKEVYDELPGDVSEILDKIETKLMDLDESVIQQIEAIGDDISTLKTTSEKHA